MKRRFVELLRDGHALYRAPTANAAFVLWAAMVSPFLHAVEFAQIGPASAESRVPGWDARGLGQLPRQGIACLDVSPDGRFLAVGTIAPPGDSNLFVLDQHGRIVRQHRAGLRWVNEVTISGDGRFVAGLSTTPEGTAGDTPRLFGFQNDEELTQVSDCLRFREFRPGGFLFHYGDHSNHLPRVSGWAGDRWVVAGDDHLHWLSPSDSTLFAAAHLGQGMTTALAANADGLVVVGRAYNIEESADRFQNVLVLKPDGPEPLIWSRSVSRDVERSPEPEKGIYGPPVPPYEDTKFQTPLAVAVDTSGNRIAVADYEGWQRVFRPRDGSADRPFGTRFTPSRPTIHVYDAQGNTVRRVGPDVFSETFWCNLTFSVDGSRLLIWPHNWTSRGLGGQPFLPANEDARTLYVLDIASGDVQAVRFPDAISSVDTGIGNKTVVGCWDHNVYLLDQAFRPIQSLPKGLDVGAASLVRVSIDGTRIVVAAGDRNCADAGCRRKATLADRSEHGRAGRRQAVDNKPETRQDCPGYLAHQRWAGPQRYGQSIRRRSTARAHSHRPKRRGIVRAELGQDRRGRLRPHASEIRAAHPRARRPRARALSVACRHRGPSGGQCRDGLRPPASYSRRRPATGSIRRCRWTSC